MSETIAQHLEKKGRQEGRQEGALRASQKILLSLLRDRFGRVPKAVQQKIKAATEPERLQACILQVTKIQSLDELPL
jgi:hypothetical protein